jgi:hypothetical protein
LRTPSYGRGIHALEAGNVGLSVPQGEITLRILQAFVQARGLIDLFA